MNHQKKRLKSLYRKLPLIAATACMQIYSQEVSPVAPANTVPARETLNASVNTSAASAATIPADTIATPATIVTTSDSSKTAGSAIQPVVPAGTNIDEPSAASPQRNLNFYGGPSTLYTNPVRGSASTPAVVPEQRLRFVDTTSLSSLTADSAAKTDLLSEDTLTADNLISKDDTAAAASAYHAPRTAKIAAAIGTTAIIGCIITYFMIRKTSEETDNDSRKRIPDPPEPPDL